MSSSENQSVPIASCQGACSTTQHTTNLHQRCRDTECFQPYGSHGVRGTTRTETPSAKLEPGTKPPLACHTTCGWGPDLQHRSPAACRGSTCSGSVPVCVLAAMASARLPAASGHSPLPTTSREHRLFQSPAAPLRNPTTKHRPGLGHMGEPSSKPHPSQQHLGCIRKLAMGGDPSLHPGSCLILGSSAWMWTYRRAQQRAAQVAEGLEHFLYDRPRAGTACSGEKARGKSDQCV